MVIYVDFFENTVFSRLFQHGKVTYTPIVPPFFVFECIINWAVLDKVYDII